MKILCVEDDQGLATLLQRSLVKQHYQVELAADGQDAWDLAEIETYDLILLDWMLPNLTGIEFCQRLRMKKHAALNPNRDTPILLMTGLDSATSKVVGLDAGADDYVVKPFDLDELLARIRALLRRRQGARSPLLQWGELCLNPNNCEVTYQDQPILLATKEYEILELFLRNPDQIFSLQRLLIGLWAVEDMPSEGAVRAHIKGLRQKLKRAGADDLIDTIYKLGYRLKPQKLAIVVPSELDQERKAALVEQVERVDEENQAEQTDQSDQKDKSKQAVTFLDAATSLVPVEFYEVWQECRQSYCDRVSIIQQAAIAMQRGTLTPEQQHDAEREAHTLIGSLGSFGLEAASQISRQIQQLLKQPDPLEAREIEQLSQLITTLRFHLEDSKVEPMPGMPTALPLWLSTLSETALKTTLLILDHDLPWATLLAAEADSWGLQAQIATDLATAQQLLASGSINAMLLDLSFPSATRSLDFLATVQQQYPHIPVVTLTAAETFEQRVAAARLGSRCFLQKPIAPAQVVAAVTQVLQQTNQLAARVLIVDDDPGLLNLLSSWLEPCGYQVTLLKEAQRFWQVLEQTAPDLLILDIEFCKSMPCDRPPSSESKAAMPAFSGIELCQVIRSDLRWNRLPVLFLSAHKDLETVQRSFAVGADDFLSKPVSAPELLTRVRTRLEQRNLWGAADLDELTGVSLRRKAQQDLTRLIRLALRQQQPFALALLDLDHFKQVNDRYGHATGDQVLSYLGKLLNQSFRQEDIVGRWGGEEFIVGMYGITKQDGINRLQEVLDQLNQYVFLAQNQESFQVTFSAGVAQLPADGCDLQTLYHRADQALYAAKAAGRNQILATQPPFETRDPVNPIPHHPQ